MIQNDNEDNNDKTITPNIGIGLYASVIPSISNPLYELEDKVKEIDKKAEKRMCVANKYYKRSKWKGAIR